MGKQDKSDGYEDLNTTFIDPNPHAFHMFENFELNRKIFVQEQEVVKLMRDVRKYLNNNVLNIEQSIKKFKYIDNDNIVKRDLLHFNTFHIKIPIAMLGIGIKDMAILNDTSIFPKKYDYDGAVKAMVILQNTYHFDLAKTRRRYLNSNHSPTSELSYYDFPTSTTVTFSAKSFLGYDDFLIFAHRATNFYHFFDSSIDFLKEAFDALNDKSTTISLSPMTNSFLGYMLDLRKYSLHLHNSYLLSQQKLIGKQFRVHPFIFNETFNPIEPNIAMKGIDKQAKY